MISSKIKKALKDSDLSQALPLLSTRVNESGNYDLRNSLYEAEATYRAMLTYLLQGYVDVESSKRRADLIRTLFVLNDQVDRIERIAKDDKQSRYVSAYKASQTVVLQNIQQRLEIELTPEEHEEEICKLFNYVWTSDAWSKIEYETALSILSSEYISKNDKAIFVSAATLALLEMFDEKKMHFLFDAYLDPDGIVNQRALVGLVIAIKIYDSRLVCFPELLSRLAIFSDDPRFVNETFDTLRTLQFSCLTDQVTSIMQNDIFPALMKGHEATKKMSLEEMKEKLTANGENPDWIDKKMQKSIKEMGELQFEGADIYMSTFRYMKGYSFFNKIPHWFYPFDTNSHLLSNIDSIAKGPNSGVIKMVLNNSLFCDSDLYSFYFMISNFTSSAHQIMKDQFGAQISDEEMDMLSADSKIKKKMSNKDICRNYIFCLYRFFVCYPFFNQFDNPFKMKKKTADGSEKAATFSPVETEAFHFLYNNREGMQMMAEFFMRKGIYEEALEMYSIINPQPIEDDANIWQKIGFCRQKLGKDKSAYKAYMLADELLPDSKWTMNHIAQLAQKLEIYDTAINYYDMLILQDENNLKYIVNKAVCQMHSNLHSEALTTLFKANYLDEDSVDIRKLMIECYLMTTQSDKASDMIADFITREDCPLEIRIVNALLAMKNESMETAYYYIREAMSFFSSAPNDGHSFNYFFYFYLSKYADVLDINADTARMLLDSVNLDIR